MFNNASSFNGDLSSWDVSSVTNMNEMFDGASALSEENQCLIHTSFSSNSGIGRMIGQSFVQPSSLWRPRVSRRLRLLYSLKSVSSVGSLRTVVIYLACHLQVKEAIPTLTTTSMATKEQMWQQLNVNFQLRDLWSSLQLACSYDRRHLSKRMAYPFR